MWEAHNWKKSDRLWLGLFTLLPVLVGLAIPLGAIMRPDAGLFGAGPGPCVLCLALPFMVFMLLMVYVPTLINNPRISKGTRYAWFIGFLIAGFVTLPLYWFLHVWPVPYQPDDDGDIGW